MQMSVLSATLYNKGFNSGKREVENQKMFVKLLIKKKNVLEVQFSRKKGK